jgi:hypothetical protein
MALLFSVFAFQRQLGTQNPKILSPKILTQNGEMKNLLCELHHRTNLTALLFSSLGFINKTTQKFEFQVPKGTPFVKGFKILSRNSFNGSKMVLSCSEGRFFWKKVLSDLS